MKMKTQSQPIKNRVSLKNLNMKKAKMSPVSWILPKMLIILMVHLMNPYSIRPVIDSSP